MGPGIRASQDLRRAPPTGGTPIWDPRRCRNRSEADEADDVPGWPKAMAGTDPIEAGV